MVANLPMKDELVDVDGVDAFRQVLHVNRVMSSRKGESCGLINKDIVGRDADSLSRGYFCFL